MSNMSYCRFQNTVGDLSDCYFNMDESDMSDQELIARKQLVKLCIKIARDHAEIAEEEIDFVAAAKARNQQGEDNEVYNADRRFYGHR